MKYVYTVYKEKSFSKAAKKLFISQPALSAVVKKVESKIQLPIFDRSTNPIQLTPAGKYYIKSIEKIMEIEMDMKAYFSVIADERKGSINIGSAAFFCAHILPKLIQEFKDKYPNYSVNSLEINADELINCLKTGVIDLSLGVEMLDPNTFVNKIWKKEHIILAVPASLEINKSLKSYRLTFDDIRSKEYLNSKYPAVNMKFFKNESFLLLRKGNDLYNRALSICKKAGFKPKINMYLDQMLTSYYVAYNGKGAVFVRDDITRYAEPTEKLFFYKIDDENAERNIMIQYKKSSPLSKIAKDFIDILNQNK